VAAWERGAGVRAHLPGSGASVGNGGASGAGLPMSGALAGEQGQHRGMKGGRRWGAGVGVCLPGRTAGIRAQLPVTGAGVGA
jgi:hypothetical protein